MNHRFKFSDSLRRINIPGSRSIIPLDISWGLASPPRLLTLFDIVAIGIVRYAYKDYSVFHAIYTYELLNVLDSNLWSWKWRWRTLRIWRKINTLRYLVNVHTCAQIGTSRSNRLFALHHCTFHYNSLRTDTRANDRTNEQTNFTYCLPAYTVQLCKNGIKMQLLLRRRVLTLVVELEITGLNIVDCSRFMVIYISWVCNYLLLEAGTVKLSTQTTDHLN